MIFRSNKRKITIIYLLLLTFPFAGCAVLSDKRPVPKKKNSLSKAIETGHTGGNESSPPPYYHRKEENDGGYENEIIERDNDKETSDYSDESVEDSFRSFFSQTKSVSVSIDQSLSCGDQIEKMTRYGAHFGIRNRETNMLVSGGISFVDFDFQRNWFYTDSLKNPKGLELGLNFRQYFAKQHNFIQPYIGAGISYGQLGWTLRNSIYDDETGEKITSDSIDYYRLAAAAGVEVKLTDYINIAVDYQADINGRSGTTKNGFENDVIDSFGSTLVGVRLNCNF